MDPRQSLDRQSLPTSGTFLLPPLLGARSLQEGRGGLKFGERAVERQKE